MKQEVSFNIDDNSGVPKFRQVVEQFKSQINQKLLAQGDALPSVNYLCKEYQLSRDTVFKAYSELKKQGIIVSVPNKGYYVADALTKVFVLLDTFKAYKQVLYDSFRDKLPENILADLNFHHYNPKVFRALVNDAIDKFDSYIVMNFDDAEVEATLPLLDPDRLLVVDWNIHASENHSYVNQDFGDSYYNCLKGGLHLFQKYEELVFVYPDFTDHPYQTVEAFERFCTDHGFAYQIIEQLTEQNIELAKAYISVSERNLAMLLEVAQKRKYQLGKDIGILSYNETPMKKFISNGISVISTDFELMGKRMAEFVLSKQKIRETIPLELIIRGSL